MDEPVTNADDAPAVAVPDEPVAPALEPVVDAVVPEVPVVAAEPAHVVEPPAPVPQVVAPTPSPVVEPPVSEVIEAAPAVESPAVESTPEPATVPEVVPESAVPIVETPAPEAEVATVDEPVVVGDVPVAVLALSDEELKAAVAYYYRKHQGEMTQKAAEARKERMNHNMQVVEEFLRQHGEAQIPQIARECNMSPRLAGNYLQKLVKSQRVKAEGAAGERRFWV